MANLSLETSIFISIIIALFMYFIGISSVIMVILIGFVAVSLIKPEERSYKVGGTAGIVLGVLIFLIIFFTPPDLPYQLAGPLVIGATMTFEGILDLILGFLFSIAMFVLLGSIGGYIAQAIFKPKKREPQETNSGTF
jgi:hypothetical protein